MELRGSATSFIRVLLLCKQYTRWTQHDATAKGHVTATVISSSVPLFCFTLPCWSNLVVTTLFCFPVNSLLLSSLMMKLASLVSASILDRVTWSLDFQFRLIPAMLAMAHFG